MTRAFDTRARKKIANVGGDFTWQKDMHVRDIQVKPITKGLARYYISAFHYSHTMPDSTRFCYAGYIGSQIVGVICYGMGCGKNEYTAIVPDIKNGTYIELTRLWCMQDAPTNTESRIVGQSLRMLPKEIQLVVSFSDSAQGHVGIIYQSANFYYIGRNEGGTMLKPRHGEPVLKHPRLLGIYRKRHKEYMDKTSEELCDILGYDVVKGGEKHRYVYLRGTKREKQRMYALIESKIEPYPKGTVKKFISENDILHEINDKETIQQLNLFDQQ